MRGWPRAKWWTAGAKASHHNEALIPVRGRVFHPAELQQRYAKARATC